MMESDDLPKNSAAEVDESDGESSGDESETETVSWKYRADFYGGNFALSVCDHWRNYKSCPVFCMFTLSFELALALNVSLHQIFLSYPRSLITNGQ